MELEGFGPYLILHHIIHPCSHLSQTRGEKKQLMLSITKQITASQEKQRTWGTEKRR